VIKKNKDKAKNDQNINNKFTIDLTKSTTKKESSSANNNIIIPKDKESNKISTNTIKIQTTIQKSRQKEPSIDSSQNYKEFAVCSIDDTEKTKELVRIYCKDNNVALKENNPNQLELKKDDNLIGLEFSKSKMRILFISGNESSAKEIMKAMLNLVL